MLKENHYRTTLAATFRAREVTGAQIGQPSRTLSEDDKLVANSFEGGEGKAAMERRQASPSRSWLDLEVVDTYKKTLSPCDLCK